MDVEKVRRGSGLGVLAEGLTYPEDAPDAQIDHVLGWEWSPEERRASSTFPSPTTRASWQTWSSSKALPLDRQSPAPRSAETVFTPHLT